jgi:hypothetical protein
VPPPFEAENAVMGTSARAAVGFCGACFSTCAATWSRPPALMFLSAVKNRWGVG